jgi:hypothetical protein
VVRSFAMTFSSMSNKDKWKSGFAFAALKQGEGHP